MFSLKDLSSELFIEMKECRWCVIWDASGYFAGDLMSAGMLLCVTEITSEDKVCGSIERSSLCAPE
jgi:hypothetical protein